MIGYPARDARFAPLPAGVRMAESLCAASTASRPWVRLRRASLATSASLRARSRSTSISSEMSRRDWPKRMAPATACATFHARSSVSELTGALSPRLFSQALKSRFMPYLKFTVQWASAPRVSCAP